MVAVDSVAIGIQLLLAGVFAVAGIAKLFDLAGSRRAMVDFGVPERLAPSAGVVLPILELATATALLFHPSARAGGIAALALLVAFCVGIGNAMRSGKAPDCNCFGQVHSAPAGPWTLARNAILAVLAGFVVVHGPGPAIDSWVGDRSAAELVAIATAIVVAALAMFATDLWTENRRLRRAQEDSSGPTPAEPESLPEGEPEGLPVGTPAPSFTVTDLQGSSHTLESLLARGRPVVLEFVDTGCSACDRLLPKLARWQSALADRVTFAVVTPGSTDRPVWDELGVKGVLVDEASEVFDAFHVRATPTAIGIDEDGRVAAAPAGGSYMPEVLVRLLIQRTRAEAPAPAAARL